MRKYIDDGNRNSGGADLYAATTSGMPSTPYKLHHNDQDLPDLKNSGSLPGIVKPVLLKEHGSTYLLLTKKHFDSQAHTDPVVIKSRS